MNKRTKIILVISAASIILLFTIFVVSNYFKETTSQDQHDSSPIEIGDWQSTGTAEYLFNLKTKYIGNNYAVSRLLDVLDLRMYGHYTFKLQTSKEPYVLIIDYNQVDGWGNILDHPEIVIEKSAILLALIDNVDEIHWVLPNMFQARKITANDLNSKYGDIKEHGKSVEDLRKLLIKLDYYTESDPISMSINALNNSGLSLIIKNHTDNEYLYGEGIILERKKNGRWVEVEQKANHCAVIAIGYILEPNQTFHKNEGWGLCYGKLTTGEYRITKSFSHMRNDNEDRWYGKEYYISAEFKI